MSPDRLMLRANDTARIENLALPGTRASAERRRGTLRERAQQSSVIMSITAMKSKLGLILICVVCSCTAQRKDMERPARHAARGVRGAVAAGSDYAAEAGMRTYFHGGNAVDAGVASMFAGSVTEFSHFGMGGEAPILIRTKDGKVYAIAGVGTMPKLATADFFRARKPQPGEVLSLDPGGLKGFIPVAGLMPALVPGMIDAGLVALREFGTKTFGEIAAPAIELADGMAIDEARS